MAARTTGIRVRVIAPHVDLPDVVDIAHGSFDYPWRRDDFVNYFRQPGCGGIVAECGSHIVGYAIAMYEQDDLFLCNFAVAPDARRLGIGTRMIANLLARSVKTGRTSIALTLDRRNTGAMLFFRYHKFQVTKLLRDFYSAADAWEMRYSFNNKGG